MKNIIGMMILLIGTAVFAGVDPVAEQATAARKTMFEDRDFAKAQAMYEKIVKDKATTNQVILSGAQAGVGMCLVRQSKFSAAQAALAKAIADYPSIGARHKANAASLSASAYLSSYEFDKAIKTARDGIKNYPDAGDTGLAQFQLLIGYGYFRQKDYDNAQVEFEKVIKNYPKATYIPTLFDAQDKVGDILQIKNKPSEANAAWMLAVQNYVWEFGAKDETGTIWKTFDKISPKVSTTEAYKSFLENTIRATRATEDNAKFLGKLKSELGKMQ